ncbi:MAG: hypothetical protein ACJ8J7_00905 [Sulfurifustaceae bacterium]
MSRFVWAAPVIAAGYSVIAYGVVTVGCTPPFEEVDFFGAPVTVFLLLALTVAALILIVLALLQTLRVLRVVQERYTGEASNARRRLAVAAACLAVAAFAAVASLGALLFQMKCPA